MSTLNNCAQCFSCTFMHRQHRSCSEQTMALQVSKLGVTSVLVTTETGVNVDVLREGLQRFAEAQA